MDLDTLVRGTSVRSGFGNYTDRERRFRASAQITSIQQALKDLWLRAMSHDVLYRDRSYQLDLLYLVQDPWNLKDSREQFRFDETNRLIRQEFGNVGRLLEVGCGEGHQSRYLARICNQHRGIDVSRRAIARARKRMQTSSFQVGTLSDMPALDTPPYDLVVACEVLYYVKDVSGAIQMMSRIGEACLITYYKNQQQHLDPFVNDIESSHRVVFCNREDSWIAVWWCNR